MVENKSTKYRHSPKLTDFIKVPDEAVRFAGGKVLREVPLANGGMAFEVWAEGKGWVRVKSGLTFGDIWPEVLLSEDEAKTLMI